MRSAQCSAQSMHTACGVCGVVSECRVFCVKSHAAFHCFGVHNCFWKAPNRSAAGPVQAVDCVASKEALLGESPGDWPVKTAASYRSVPLTVVNFFSSFIVDTCTGTKGRSSRPTPSLQDITHLTTKAAQMATHSSQREDHHRQNDTTHSTANLCAKPQKISIF